MEPQEYHLPIQPTAVQCQIYNEWTVGDTGTGEACRLVIQSPTGAAYYIDYPTFKRYYHRDSTPEKEIGDRMFAFLHAIINTGNKDTETWTMSVPIEYLELIRDYGKPINKPKPEWTDSWWELHEVADDLNLDDLFEALGGK